MYNMCYIIYNIQYCHCNMIYNIYNIYNIIYSMKHILCTYIMSNKQYVYIYIYIFYIICIIP